MSSYFVDKQDCKHHRISPGVDIYTAWGNQMMLSLVEMEPHAVVEEHAHPHEQLGLMLEGTADFTIGGQQRRYGWPDVAHSRRRTSQGRGRSSAGASAGYLPSAARRLSVSQPRAVSCVRGFAIACLLCATPLAGGCSALPKPWRKVPLDASTGFYQSASLSYRLDAGRLQQPLDVARVEGLRVSYDQVASSPLADESIGTLALAYPHPAGHDGMAQAKFTLDSAAPRTAASKASRASWNPFKSKETPAPSAPTKVTGHQPEIHEIWLLDIPRAEADEYFKLLSSLGFYNTERPGAVGTQMNVEINGKKLQKNWEQIPQLNALAQRVRREGQLVAYHRPDLLAGSKTDTIVSTGVYAHLLAENGVASPASTAMTSSAFSMPAVTSTSATDAIARLPSVTR